MLEGGHVAGKVEAEKTGDGGQRSQRERARHRQHRLHHEIPARAVRPSALQTEVMAVHVYGIGHGDTYQDDGQRIGDHIHRHCLCRHGAQGDHHGKHGDQGAHHSRAELAECQQNNQEYDQPGKRHQAARVGIDIAGQVTHDGALARHMHVHRRR